MTCQGFPSFQGLPVDVPFNLQAQGVACAVPNEIAKLVKITPTSLLFVG